MNSLGDAPEIALQKLFQYLPVHDVLNLRLTCSRIFKISRHRRFYERVQICMIKIQPVDLELFGRFCKDFGSSVRYKTEGCSEEQLNLMLPPAENVEDILVNVKYLNHICMNWKHVKNLVVDFSIADDLKEEEITFSCLSMLIRLTELTIKGSEDYFKKLLLCKSFLQDIILNSKQISKLSFRSIDVEGKSYDSVRKLIRNANHVKKWSMVNVNVTDSGFFFLPKNIRTLELRHSNCVSFKDYHFDNLETLILEGVKFDNEFFEFRNLKNLEIIGTLRGDGLEGKRVICPRLQVLRLDNIYHVENFECLFCDSLEALYVTSVYDMEELDQSRVINRCQSLRKFMYERNSTAYAGTYCIGISESDT